MGAFSQRFLHPTAHARTVARANRALAAMPNAPFSRPQANFARAGAPNTPPADKGQLWGSCNRSICLAPQAVYFNRSTRAYYCKHCAAVLNRANPSAPGEGPLCFLEPEVKAKLGEERLQRRVPQPEAGAPGRSRL